MKRLIRIIRQPYRILWFIGDHNLLPMPDSLFLKIAFKCRMNSKLDLDNPKTFNEKLQWLKLYDRKSKYTNMVDKYKAKDYVSKEIGSQYVIPTFGVYDNFDEINFDELPTKFVIKCTHDSGGIVIVEDKDSFDKIKARKKINKCLKNNYYYSGREWPYKNVKPRIIIEEYLKDKKLNELRDYKFFCFNGIPKYFKIDFNRFSKHQANYFDINCKLQEFGEIVFPPDLKKKLDMPRNLKKMIDLAKILSKDIPFLRVDFYEINGKIYFGELTFFPASGFGKFEPDEWDLKLGNMIDLSLVKKDED